ncbi:MAG TPA: glycosyltransferase family 39 protein [Candidatus Nanoarchaeia archaeon]|nr:glycosyltransferase family 39 protein [Candidatus Nanoarchaeia archaeon]
MNKFTKFVASNWMLIIILVLAVFLRVYNLDDKEFGTDEDFSVNYSKVLIKGDFDSILSKDVHPPGYYLFIGVLLNIYDSVYFARIVSILIGIIGIIVFYFLALKLSDKKIALLSSFLLALNPMHVIYSSQLRFYILLSLIYVLATWALYRFIFENNKKMIYLLAPLYIASFYTHFYSVFIIGAHFLAVLFFWFKNKNIDIKRYFYGLLVVAFFALLYLPRFLKQFNYTIVQPGHFALESLKLHEVPYPFFKFASMINISALNDMQYLFVLAGILSLLMLYGIYNFYRKDKDKAIFVSIIFFSIFIFPLVINPFIALLSSGRTTLYYFRYLSFLVPFYVFFVAEGLDFRNKFLKYVLILLIVVGWAIVLNYYYNISVSGGWSKYIGV